jgi:hypothetical protein
LADPEYEDLSEKGTDERKQIARARWESLPAVLKDVFENAPKLSMYEVLRKLGVHAQPTRAVEWAYPAANGAVVVTVWHDQIREDPERGLYYYIPTSKWRRSGGIAQQRAAQMLTLLSSNAGKAVKAMLLKHEWDKNNTQFAKVVVPDIRSWSLEQLSETEFVLRRSVRR